jgi:hypothetical protein
MFQIPGLPGITREHLEETMHLSHQLAEKIRWNPGDILVIDNKKWLRGRCPFFGDRLVYVQTLKRYV